MTTARLLIVEDSQRDLDLILREFRQSGLSNVCKRVETADEMRLALEAGSWDAIISDNSLPQFNAEQALEVLQNSGFEIPFIIVSGVIGEERAVELMKAGAQDYVSKRNLSRLPFVIERELRDAVARRERRRIEAELKALNAERERMLNQRSALLDINNALIANLDRQLLCQAVFGAIGSTLPCNGVVVVLRTSDSADLDAVVPGTAKIRAPESGWLSLVENPVHRVLSSGEILGWVADSGNDSYWDEPMKRAGIRSFTAAPLKTRGRPFGVLMLTSSAADLLSSQETEFFSQVCQQVSLAVQNVLSYEQIASLKSQLENENAYLIEEIKSEHNFEEMVGNSPAFRTLTETISRVAPTDATVLITGESGTGKELVARAVHSLSRRRHKPLVKVNCAAISAGLVESELFGHTKGAFTGAVERRIGRFEFAQGGTLFLDEVGELPLETQAKLLRVLQEREFEPVGSNQTIRTDVRIIAATNRQLKEAVADGKFRADLYFRLSVFPVFSPPLRERRSDIPELVSHILSNYNRQFGRGITSVSDESMHRLINYDWPGNIRELQNVLARAVVLSSGNVLRMADEFFPTIQPTSDKVAIVETTDTPRPHSTLSEMERDHIIRVLKEANWVIEGPRGAANSLKLHPNTLRSRMKKLKIVRPKSANE